MNKCTAPQTRKQWRKWWRKQKRCPGSYSQLVYALSAIPDPRWRQGRRYELVVFLFILIVGTAWGRSSVSECVEFATTNRDWLATCIPLPISLTLPCASTIIRGIRQIKMTSVVEAISTWWDTMFGTKLVKAMALDGKAIRALSNHSSIHHILNLFSHDSHQLIDQEGVTSKENEIPATPRLLERVLLAEATITGDALLTQTAITRSILDNGGHYLLSVKHNQQELHDILSATFNDPWSKTTTYAQFNYRKTRAITTQVTVTNSIDKRSLHQRGWSNLNTAVMIHRWGERTDKGVTHQVDETVYAISDRPDLTAQEAYQLIKGHWQVENNYHWTKDHVYHEDQHRLTAGVAPQLMACIRGLVLGLMKQQGLREVSKAIRGFQNTPDAFQDFLIRAHIV